MNFNRKRHKVLQLLSTSRIQFDSGRMESDFKLGVGFDDLQRELNCDLDTCELIYSTLYNEKEVEHTNTSVYGLFATQKGLTSYSERKYVKENNKIITNYSRNFVQIVIPILSLIVAILAISLKIDNANKDVNEKILDLQRQINKQSHIIGKFKQQNLEIKPDPSKKPSANSRHD